MPESSGTATLSTALETSRTVALSRRIYGTLGDVSSADGLGAALERSRCARVARWIARVSRHSACYRWLTTPPETRVIVVDLRSTVVLGPVVSLIDWLVGQLAPAWRSSRSGRAIGWFTRRVETTLGSVVDGTGREPEPRDRSGDERGDRVEQATKE